MTDQDWIELGRRAVACRGWRWMPGMLAIDSTGVHSPARVYHTNKAIVYISPSDGETHTGGLDCYDVPDLRDPATLGCLLALVREAWGTAHIRQANHINGSRAWECACNDGDGWSYFSAHTEAHALVAALESAPEHTR